MPPQFIKILFHDYICYHNIASFEHYVSIMRAPSRTSSKYCSEGIRLLSESRDATTVGSISAQYVLTRARANQAPSMHADLFIAPIRGTTSSNCCTKLK